MTEDRSSRIAHVFSPSPIRAATSQEAFLKDLRLFLEAWPGTDEFCGIGGVSYKSENDLSLNKGGGCFTYTMWSGDLEKFKKIVEGSKTNSDEMQTLRSSSDIAGWPSCIHCLSTRCFQAINLFRMNESGPNFRQFSMRSLNFELLYTTMYQRFKDCFNSVWWLATIKDLF